MVEPEDIRLQRMGLSKLEGADGFIDHEDEWDERKKMNDNLVASELFATKPKDPYFEIEENPGDKVYISCHLPIPGLIISATGFQQIKIKIYLKSIHGLWRRLQSGAKNTSISMKSKQSQECYL